MTKDELIKTRDEASKYVSQLHDYSRPDTFSSLNNEQKALITQDYFVMKNHVNILNRLINLGE